MATILEQAERIAGRIPCDWPTMESVNDAVRDARKTVADLRQASKDAVERVELTARRRPLAALGVAATAGFTTGAVVAFMLGWFAARRVGR